MRTYTVGVAGKGFWWPMFAMFGLFFVLRVSAEVTVVDDAGQEVALTSPAMRVVSLAMGLLAVSALFGVYKSSIEATYEKYGLD